MAKITTILLECIKLPDIASYCQPVKNLLQQVFWFPYNILEKMRMPTHVPNANPVET